MACYLVAASFGPLRKAFGTVHRPVAIIGTGLLIIVAMFTAAQVIRPAIFQDRSEFTARLSGLATAESYECWWPVWADHLALEQPAPVSAGDRSVAIQEWRSERRTFSVEAGENLMARIGTFYYPLWRAEVNGNAVDVFDGDDGAINIRLPADGVDVAIVFIEPAAVRLSTIVGIITWLGIVIGLLLHIGFNRFAMHSTRVGINRLLPEDCFGMPESSASDLK